jgi:hypothetical protein
MTGCLILFKIISPEPLVKLSPEKQQGIPMLTSRNEILLH